jgi:hypothetical protein
MLKKERDLERRASPLTRRIQFSLYVPREVDLADKTLSSHRLDKAC